MFCGINSSPIWNFLCNNGNCIICINDSRFNPNNCHFSKIVTDLSSETIEFADYQQADLAPEFVPETPYTSLQFRLLSAVQNVVCIYAKWQLMFCY